MLQHSRSAAQVLFAAAVAAGLFEIVQAWFLDMLVGLIMAVAFGIAFLALGEWFRRTGSRTPAVMLVVLFALELSFLPAYDRSSVLDWLAQVGFAVIALVGLVAGVMTIWETSRASQTVARSRPSQ